MRVRVAQQHLIGDLAAFLRERNLLVVRRSENELEALPLNAVSERHDRATIEQHLAKTGVRDPASTCAGPGDGGGSAAPSASTSSMRRHRAARRARAASNGRSRGTRRGPPDPTLTLLATHER